MSFNLYRFFLLVAILPVAAHGATTGYTCSFLIEATPNGLSKANSPFELHFIVDTNTHKAYLMGNVGVSDVEVIPNADGVSFIEVTASGNVMVTSVTNSGEAVHSRNSIMLKELTPSQLYGKCIRQ